MRYIHTYSLILRALVLLCCANTTFASQYAILKADDFAKTPAYLEYIELIEKKGIVSGLGLIGKFFKKPDPELVSLIKRLHKSGNFEFWNHGYDHDWGGNKDGTAEFKGKSIPYQVQQLQKAQQIVKQKTGIVMTSFGAPGNGIDGNTAIALKKVPEIKTWMFNKKIRPPENVIGLSVRTNIEWKEGKRKMPDVERFKKYYDVNAPYVLLQVHPKGYTKKSFEQLEKTIDFLISKKVRFILPNNKDFYEFSQTIKPN
jgi:peptidoglycan/xylan/chitin deacetylase (PgdA/CDA1 family)